MQKNISSSKILGLAVISLAAVYWLPRLFEHGLFNDGIFYGMLAQNLANGKATWFHLHGTNFLEPNFFGNPPMHIWILSFFFRLFHAAFFIEKIYSLLTFVATAFLIERLWKIEFKSSVVGLPTNNGTALPVLFFLFIPLVPWCYSNNLIENTMTVFTTASVYFILRFCSTQKNLLLLAILSALFIFFGLLTKALPALFPLAVPVLWLLSHRPSKSRKIILFNVLQIIFPALFCFILFSNPDAKNYLQNYWHVQINPLFGAQQNETNSNFKIVFDLFWQLIPLMIIVLFSWLLTGETKKNNVVGRETNNGIVLRYFLIALAASLPIMITRKQSFYYLLPSLPFFAMAAALFVEERLSVFGWKPTTAFLNLKYFQKIKFFTAISFSFIIVAMLSLCVFNYGKISRDEGKLQDIFNFKNEIDSTKNIFISKNLIWDYPFHEYMYRYYEINCRYEERFIANSILVISKGEKPPYSSDSVHLLGHGEVYNIYLEKFHLDSVTVKLNYKNFQSEKFKFDSHQILVYRNELNKFISPAGYSKNQIEYALDRDDNFVRYISLKNKIDRKQLTVEYIESLFYFSHIDFFFDSPNGLELKSISEINIEGYGDCFLCELYYQSPMNSEQDKPLVLVNIEKSEAVICDFSDFDFSKISSGEIRTDFKIRPDNHIFYIYQYNKEVDKFLCLAGKNRKN